MTKEQLRNYRALKRESRRIEQRLRTMERRHDYEQATIRPLKEFYRKKLEVLVAEALKIEEAIETLTPTERELIRLRYLDGLPWHRVAAGIHYSETQTYRLDKATLRKLKRL